MTRNLSNADRAVRAALGILLLALVFVGPKSLWGLIGVVPLGTAAFGHCPLYGLLGVTTRRRPAGSPSVRA